MIDLDRHRAARRELRVPSDSAAIHGLNRQLGPSWSVSATDVGALAVHPDGITVRTNTRSKVFVIYRGDGTYVTDGHGRDWRAIADIARAYVQPKRR